MVAQLLATTLWSRFPGYFLSCAHHAPSVALILGLVHAYLARVNSDALPFLREGFAEALRGIVTVGSLTVEGVLDAIPKSNLEWWEYTVAGHFARWLLDHYGPELVLELYARTSRGMTVEEVSAVFEDVLGSPLLTILALYLPEGRYFYPSIGPFACGRGEPLHWQGDTLEWQGEMSCDDGQTISLHPDADRVSLTRRATLEIGEPGIYGIHILSGGNVGLTRCLAVPLDYEDDVAWEGLDDRVVLEHWEREPLAKLAVLWDVSPWEYEVELREGIYDLWVATSSDVDPPGSRDIWVTIRRLP